MSKIEVNTVEPQCGTNLTLGASGDTIIIPAGANATLGGSGSTITIPSGATISNQGTAAGFGPTGAVSWNTTKITADPNPAVSGVGYFADTTSAAFTITLPSSPSAGAVVGIADYANTFATNNLTVNRNGSNIGGEAFNATLKVNGVSVTFVYVDATQGWIVTDSGQRSNLDTTTYITATGGTITECGDYKIHTFTGPGTFTVCEISSTPAENTVGYLVIAGGAGGGSARGGGGGAGGFREGRNVPIDNFTASPLVADAPTNAITITATSYPITVGGGGPGGPGPLGQGSNSIFSTITSTGGGGTVGPNPSAIGQPGGSGGGANGRFAGSGGLGNTPPVAPSQGNNGGSSTGAAASPDTFSGAGGGGAGAAGSANPSATQAGAGGNGVATSISGSPTSYAGGGGGGGGSTIGGTCSVGGAGGSGGGGPGKGSIDGPPTVGTAGTVNTGGGGGGGGIDTPGSDTTGGNGGSGIVVIRYKFQN
jgi:hypothetical protein